MDEVAEATKIRKTAFAKWASKFEKKFHHHFDGEIVEGKWSNRDSTPTFWLVGAHNHDIVGTKIQIGSIRKPSVNSFHELPDDTPFKANVEIKYNHRIIPKQNTSSFFPKNWNIQRVKEEIALVYDDLVKSGKDFSKPPYKHRIMNSDNTFKILIEFDQQGNITSAYPFIQ